MSYLITRGPLGGAVLLTVALLLLPSCISLGAQGFKDKSVIRDYYLNGEIKSETLRTTKGKNLSMAPPFNSNTKTDHNLTITDSEGWNVIMGTVADLHGGDISETIKATEKLMISGALEAL